MRTREAVYREDYRYGQKDEATLYRKRCPGYTKVRTTHTSRVVAKCNGYFSDAMEKKVKNNEIKKHGYNCVRGGKYTNSKTFYRRGSGK